MQEESDAYTTQTCRHRTHVHVVHTYNNSIIEGKVVQLTTQGKATQLPEKVIFKEKLAACSMYVMECSTKLL